MSDVRGCCGVALAGPLAQHFAPLASEPLAEATIAEVADLAGELADTDLRPMWSLDAGAGVRWSLQTRAGDGALVFSIDGAPALVADPSAGAISIDRHPSSIAVQLVAAVGAPALAAARGAVPVHGAAAAREDGGTTLIVGPSGAGKSSLLAALADAGWRPIAEDVTTVDLDPDGSARCWPGPPWVRLAHGQPGPAGSEPRADPTDKASWDLQGRLPTGPVRLDRIVELAAPGADTAELRLLTPQQAIAVLPPHVAWLSSRPRGAAAFAASVSLSRRCPVVRLELPHHPDWWKLAVDLLQEPAP